MHKNNILLGFLSKIRRIYLDVYRIFFLSEFIIEIIAPFFDPQGNSWEYKTQWIGSRENWNRKP